MGIPEYARIQLVILPGAAHLPAVPLFELERMLTTLRASSNEKVDSRAFGRLFSCRPNRSSRMLRSVTGSNTAAIDRLELIARPESLAAATLARPVRVAGLSPLRKAAI